MNRIEIVREIVDKLLLNMPDVHERRCAYVHLYGVAQACAILATKRKENAELATIAGMLHDIYVYTTTERAEHEHKGAIMAKELLEQINAFSETEINVICTAIYNHGDKSHIHNSFDEILKDADVLQHTFYNPLFEIKEHEQMRYNNLVAELKIL